MSQTHEADKNIVLLGSESPGRKHVLQKFGFSFDCLAPKVNEKSLSGSISFQEAVNLVSYNSKLKMNTLIEKINNLKKYSLLITSDTTVFFNNKIYEKTYDKELATKILQELAGHTHQVITGVTLYISDGEVKKNFTTIEFFEVTDVTLTNDTTLLNYYLQSDDCLGKAGCYGIQGSGSLLIEDVKGSIDNVIGLPINKIIKNLNGYILNLLKIKT